MTKRRKKFDLLGQDFKRDPFPTFREMRAAGPAVKNHFPILGDITFTTTHAACETLLKDTDRFSVDMNRAKGSFILGVLKRLPGIRPLMDNMLQKDGTDHRRLRKLVDGAFRRDEIEKLTPQIEHIANSLIGDLRASDDGDLVKHVARDLPLAVICELLGLPQQDRPKFTKWMASMSDIKSISVIFKMILSIGHINRYLRAKFDERRKDPKDDLISKLVMIEEDGDRFSNDELLAMCFLLFVAGHETTTHLISGGVLALLQNPDQLQKLRDNPDLTTSAVDELLRYVSPVQMTKPRFPLMDTEIAGVPVKKGQFIMALLASANSDPEMFENPETLDIARQNNRHLALGGGVHFCLGSWLAKKEMEILLTCLLKKAPGLALKIPESELSWTTRGGLRALKLLPLNL